MKMKKVLWVLVMLVMGSFSLQARERQVDVARAREALSAIRTEGKAGVVSVRSHSDRRGVRVEGVASERLSKLRAVTFGSRTPVAPECYQEFRGLDDQNNVVIGVDCFMDFAVVNPVRVLVNGVRTDRDIVAQSTVESHPGSPYKVSGSTTSEFHAFITLPGKLGENKIELEIAWHPDFYFWVEYDHEIVPLGLLLDGCTDGDKVNLLFVFDLFDGTFPKNPEVSMNGGTLEPVEPPVVEEEDFLIFLFMTVTKEDYQELYEESEEYGAFFQVTGGEGETEISWDDYLWEPEDLGKCGACYDPETGEEIPCEDRESVRSPGAK